MVKEASGAVCAEAHTDHRQVEYFQRLLDAIPVPIFYKDDKGCYIGCNAAFAGFLGLPREDIIGKTVYDLAPPHLAGIYADADAALFAAGGVQTYESTVSGKDGNISDVVFYKSVFAGPDPHQTSIVGTIFDITGRKKVEEAIELLAYHDTLTGLPNRTLLKDRLGQAVSQARRDGQKVGVFFLDLDRFKKVNDSMGHATGDLLLKSVAGRLEQTVRESDTVARFGGDEFVVVCPGIIDLRDVTNIAVKILEKLALPVVLDGQELFSSASVGISVFPGDGEDVESLLKHADIAMYAAKEQGRNTFQYYSSRMNLRAMERLKIESSMRRALEQNEFRVVYHPQFDLRLGRITGMEALIRWHHPKKGVISPADFIPLAEESGLIHPIGEWVLRTACAHTRSWQESGHAPLRVAVNISGQQFKQRNFIEMLSRVLQETGLDPQYLELELTESVLMDNVEETASRLAAVKELGVHLAIDDFGTGYSSLSYLKNFPIDRIKIAHAFLCDVDSDQDNAAIVEAIISMARSLDLRLVAEGVETGEQIRFLRERHCHEMQGFYFGRPMGGDDFADFLAAGGMAGEDYLPADPAKPVQLPFQYQLSYS